MNRRAARTITVAATAAIALSAVGCASNAVDRRTADIRRNLTPELTSHALTMDELKNREAINTDNGLRMIVDDFLAFWHADEPSQLSDIPSTF